LPCFAFATNSLCIPPFLFSLYQGTVADKTCVQVGKKNAGGTAFVAPWLDSWMCLPLGAPYTLSWVHNGVTPAGTTCVPWTNPDDAAFAGTNYQLCAATAPATGTPYGTDGIQYYHYALPVLDTIALTNGPTLGGTTITLTGSNFGPLNNGVTTVAVGTTNCPVTYVDQVGSSRSFLSIQSLLALPLLQNIHSLFNHAHFGDFNHYLPCLAFAT
jgi:hypothetical protein